MDKEFLNRYFDSIRHMNYVVLRNWRTLPDGIDKDHPDLDVLVSVDDYQNMKLASPEWVDLRTPLDGYFPLNIAHKLLEQKRPYKNFFVPSPQYYFISLYYHAMLHKSPDKFPLYYAELKRSFFEWIKPVKCEDKGVGFHYDTR